MDQARDQPGSLLGKSGYAELQAGPCISRPNCDKIIKGTKIIPNSKINKKSNGSLPLVSNGIQHFACFYTFSNSKIQMFIKIY